jgi:DNA-binding HxlR family transcriptional regulator
VRAGWADSRVARLGVVYADHLRLTIMTELSHREMSSKEFLEEIGGGSIGAIRNHFKVLLENDWLLKVEERPQPRGRPQHVYRAAEPAVFDDESWAQIPIPIRDSFTGQLLVQLSERLDSALYLKPTDSAGNFQDLASHDLSESGWQSSVSVVNRCYQQLAQLQVAANKRRNRSGPPISMLVALAAFEGPSPIAKQRGRSDDREKALSTSTLHSDIPWNVRLAKVFVDRMSLDIVNLLTCDVMNASEVAQRLNTYPQAITKRFNALVGLGWVAREERAGTQEHFYRALRPVLSSQAILEPIEHPKRVGRYWEIYERFVDRGVSAVTEGTLNKRPDRHLTWNVLFLDEEGLEAAQRVLRDASCEINAIRQAHALAPPPQTNPFTFFLAGLWHADR